MENKPTSANREATKTEMPANAPASPPPAKNFSRTAPPAVKRGPGRPPKLDPPGGKPSKPFASIAADGSQAPAAAPILASPDNAPMSAPAAVRGLLKAITPLAGVCTAMATKIDLMKAMQIWQFSEHELREIEKPGGAFLEKYAPSIDSFGVEIEFAGAVFSVIFPKILAIVAAKKLLEASSAKPSAPAPAPRPAAAAPPAAPPPPTPIRAAAPPAPQTVQHSQTHPPQTEIEIELPSPFSIDLNAGMSASVAGVGL